VDFVVVENPISTFAGQMLSARASLVIGQIKKLLNA
jgi:hypothetical protein